MPKTKRRKNLFGFGRKSSGNYIPASGGVAHHMAKRKVKASSAASDSKYDDVAKSLAGKPYKSLSSSQQATVRGIASKMNPRRKRNPPASIHREVAGAAKDVARKGGHGYAGESLPNLMSGAAVDWINDNQKAFQHMVSTQRIILSKRGVGAKYGLRKRNLEIGLPSNQFVNAKVRMKGGKIQVMADERVLGKAGFRAGAGLSGVSVSGGAKLNPKRKRRAKRK